MRVHTVDRFCLYDVNFGYVRFGVVLPLLRYNIVTHMHWENVINNSVLFFYLSHSQFLYSFKKKNVFRILTYKILLMPVCIFIYHIMFQRRFRLDKLMF